MRRLPSWLGLACGLALILFCYRAALFAGGQYGFRDSAHFYYPLYQKVQSEWNAGRWPLWDGSENAGMPLLGNPTAAVLYPGKLLFALLSYPWATRLYAVAHTALAFAGMWLLVRPWGVRGAGATIAALGYAFGAPILFQYCNIIFLVGAAWIPWGLRAIDRWVRMRRPMALIELALILAMQVLGGDPESAYLLGLCAGGYALGLSWHESRGTNPDQHAPARPKGRRWWPIGLTLLVAWVAVTLIAARILPGRRPVDNGGPMLSFPWVPWLPKLALLAWCGVGLRLIDLWRRGRPLARTLMPRLVGLAAAAGLAGGVAAAQLLPVLEFTGSTARATDEGPHDYYPFSLEPYRVVEMAWPGVFGRPFGEKVSWIGAIPPRGNHRLWSPSIYLGGLTLLLAVGAWGFRSGTPWRAWLSAVALVSLIAGFGEFASPIWVARFVPAVAEAIGGHDEPNPNTIRLDGWLRDGDGSPYSILAVVLPGFHSFRYPSKLFTFTAVALAALAGMGWETAVGGRGRRFLRLATVGGAATAVVLLGVTLARGRLVDALVDLHVADYFGNLDAPLAIRGVQMALLQGLILFGVGAVLVRIAPRRPVLAGSLAVLVAAADLAVANGHLVITVPQREFEVRPEVLQKIDAAERADPAPGPFRIHRTPIWQPVSHNRSVNPTQMLQWERDTLQPKYGLLHDVEYTYTVGTAELYDYEWFFAPFKRKVQDPEVARQLGIPPNDAIVVYPRRGFDLWNTRYFVVPFLPAWGDTDRGIATFTSHTERIDPPPDAFKGPDGRALMRQWAETHDYQILRNKDAYPRAWVVHDIRLKPPILDLNRKSRTRTVYEILYPADAYWFDPEWLLYDPRRTAWVETEDGLPLAPFGPGGSPLHSETASVVDRSPQRVELDVSLVRPGLVVLADAFYPGWRLTIDGQPATIHRTNRMMRGATVPSGRHRLVYTYDPGSFRVGGVISVASLVVVALYPLGLGWRRKWRLEQVAIRG